MTFDAIYAKDVRKVQREKHAVLIDMRDSIEYQRGHLPGAINYPVDDEDAFEKAWNKNRYYIVYCERGGSSMRLARALGRKGYHIATVIGGYQAVEQRQY